MPKFDNFLCIKYSSKREKTIKKLKKRFKWRIKNLHGIWKWNVKNVKSTFLRREERGWQKSNTKWHMEDEPCISYLFHIAVFLLSFFSASHDLAILRRKTMSINKRLPMSSRQLHPKFQIMAAKIGSKIVFFDLFCFSLIWSKMLKQSFIWQNFFSCLP